MSERQDKFIEYARLLSHEAWKFDHNDQLRRKRCGGDPRRWYRLYAASAERFVGKVMRMVEKFE